MYKIDNGQISIHEFDRPIGMKLHEDNRCVKKAMTIPWTAIEKRYAVLFTNQKGNVAKPLQLGLGACIIQAEYHFFDVDSDTDDSGTSVFSILLRLQGLR